MQAIACGSVVVRARLLRMRTTAFLQHTFDELPRQSGLSLVNRDKDFASVDLAVVILCHNPIYIVVSKHLGYSATCRTNDTGYRCNRWNRRCG